MKKVTKGKAGYLAEKKKRLGLQALAEFAVVALILIIGYVIYKNKTEYIYGSCNRRLSSGSACAGGVYRDVSL